MKTYTATPRDLTQIGLPSELDALRETVAEYVHDVWAAKRMAEGWTYGPARDDQKMEHPNLVHYDELSEADKAFDRATADATLKLIVAHGWQLVPPANGLKQIHGVADDT